MDHKMETRLENIEKYISQQAITKKEILNLKEAASYAGISKSFLYKLTASRTIPFYRPSSKLIFFKRAEFEAWIFENRLSTKRENEELSLKRARR